jgi:hypothetical protein
MNREIHVPLRESLEVKFLRATRPITEGVSGRLEDAARKQILAALKQATGLLPVPREPLICWA